MLTFLTYLVYIISTNCFLIFLESVYPFLLVVCKYVLNMSFFSGLIAKMVNCSPHLCPVCVGVVSIGRSY